jgi:D-alanyl-D-alanine carboxypeptidase
MVRTPRRAVALVFALLACLVSSCRTSVGSVGAERERTAPVALLAVALAATTATPSADAMAPPPHVPDPSPFGTAAAVARYTCPQVLAGNPFRSFISGADTRVSFVDGDDLLALVNRSPAGALPPTYVPTDLVDVRDGSPRTAAECEGAHACLRADAAKALGGMLDRMRADGVRGHVQSAFRGFGTQCWVFASWARQARGGFCEATEQSALPGHSQHQLGTTLDLFTVDWAERGKKSGQGVFRNGFGCSPGGLWIDENAWRYGFVVSYPIDPEDRRDGSRCEVRSDWAVPIDPKTGYKHEPWHVRFVGAENAAKYHEAWLASGPGTPAEITLEQWIRARRALVGDAELPVCDGCGCGACSTLASDGDHGPCGDASLRLDGAGRVVAPDEEPRIVEARAAPAADSSDGALLLDVSVHASPHTPTQTPITTTAGPSYRDGAAFGALVAYPGGRPHAYVDLPGAWRVAAQPVPLHGPRWPWRASLARADLGATWNRANVVLPAKAGDSSVRLRLVVAKETTAVEVTLLRDGKEHSVVRVTLPGSTRP